MSGIRGSKEVWTQGHWKARPGSKPPGERVIVPSPSMTLAGLQAMPSDYNRKRWFANVRAALTKTERKLEMNGPTSPRPSPQPTITSLLAAGNTEPVAPATMDVGETSAMAQASVRARRAARRAQQAPWSQSPGDGSRGLRSGSRASRAIHLSNSPIAGEDDVCAGPLQIAQQQPAP